MHMAYLQADALVGATLPAMAGPATQRRQAVASAQVAVARACRSVGHAFKRLTLIETQGGGVYAHLRRLVRLTHLQHAVGATDIPLQETI